MSTELSYRVSKCVYVCLVDSDGVPRIISMKLRIPGLLLVEAVITSCERKKTRVCVYSELSEEFEV